MTIKYVGKAFLFCSLFIFTSLSYATVKGIYVTQYNFENTAFLTHLIKGAKAAGIDTFVVDMEIPSKRYRDNITYLKENNIKYVARVIMFPGGGTEEQIKNPAIWQKKYALVQQAVNWGANEIQLDYIRYSSKHHASPQNAKDILNIIGWYKSKLSGQNIPLQVDVFGIASFGESKYIGQNIKLFSQSVDAVCPMVYPSHYVPFREHFQTPYKTVYSSLKHLKGQFEDQEVPIKVIAYIELSNYHYPVSHPKTLDYITAQIKAVNAADVEGWYAWSPHNRYDNLFRVLQGKNILDDTAEPAEEANVAVNDDADDGAKVTRHVAADARLAEEKKAAAPTPIEKPAAAPAQKNNYGAAQGVRNGQVIMPF